MPNSNAVVLLRHLWHEVDPWPRALYQDHADRDLCLWISVILSATASEGASRDPRLPQGLWLQSWQSEPGAVCGAGA